MAKKAKTVDAPTPEPDAITPEAPVWEPPQGEIVLDSADHDRVISVGGVRYEHVSDAPDGRWVYRRS